MDFVSTIRRAVGVVEESGVPEDLRAIALDNVLRVMWRNEVEVQYQSAGAGERKEDAKSLAQRNKFDSVCHELGLVRESVEEIYTIREEEVILTLNELRLPDGTKERLLTISLIAMFIRQGLELDVETAQPVLSGYAEQYGAKDSNLSRHLNTLGQWCQVTKLGGVRTFRLKRSGWQEAANRIQTLTE